eukprot:316115_1
MLTIVDLGHKPRSSCYLIELELYPHSEHKPLRILVDAPIEISDILDFVPNQIPSTLHFGSNQSQQNKTNWKLDESGKQWIIGNKRFINAPFYFTVPFQTTLIKDKSQSNAMDIDRKNSKNTNTKKRKFLSDDDPDHRLPLPSLFTQNQVLVDIVLISNHESILDPITMTDIAMQHQLKPTHKTEREEHKDNGSHIKVAMAAHCKIYATAPTKQYGKLLMKSLASSNNEYFVLNPNKRVTDSDDLLYDMDLIEECINSIITVQYNETLSVISGGELDVVCISSGLYIGSSNWILKGSAMDLSIGIVMGSCGATNRHPQSITLSPHFDIVGNIDLVLIDDLQSILLNDESANDSLQAMEKKIIETISNKGTVLMPSSSCGIAYDMLERIHAMLNKYDSSHVAIYFISSIAKESISYSSIYGEYLHPNNMRHVSEAKYPFGFQTYIAHNRLIHCTDWDNQFCFKYIKSNVSESRIIICESPSLRYGNILHLLQIFNHPKNTLILTDPHYIPHLALHPFKNDGYMNWNDKRTENEYNDTLKLQIASYPIDARLQIKELCVLLRKVCPKYAFIPNNYFNRIKQNMNKFIDINALQINQQKNQKHLPHHTSTTISPVLLEKIKNIEYFTMSRGVYHSVELNKSDKTNGSKTLYLDPLISHNLYPRVINPNHSSNMFVASVCGTVDYNTNHDKLILKNDAFVNQKCVLYKTLIGTLNINGLINHLKTQQTRCGVTKIRKTQPNVLSFNMNRDKNVQILTSDNVTNIRCNDLLDKENLTHILDLVTQHLLSF